MVNLNLWYAENRLHDDLINYKLHELHKRSVLHTFVINKIIETSVKAHTCKLVQQRDIKDMHIPTLSHIHIHSICANKQTNIQAHWEKPGTIEHLI